MRHLGLHSIAMIMAFLFLCASLLFYTLLKRYYEDEAFHRIEMATGFDKALQNYIEEVQKPFIYGLIREGKLPGDFFDSTLLSSTFIAGNVNDRFVANKLNTDRLVRLKFVSDNPTNIRNKVNEYERSVLEKFRTNRLFNYKDRLQIDGKENFFYALPVAVNTDMCLKCHGDPSDAPMSMRQRYGDHNGFGESKGHLRAMIVAYTPTDADNEKMLLFFWSIESLMVLVFALIYGIIYRYSLTIRNKDDLIARQTRFAAMGEMIEMIAHQWRQPLTGMGMTVYNMKLDIELSMVDEKKWENQLDIIEKQVAYLSHTIDDFRNFLKPNQSFVQTNLKKLIDDSFYVIASTFESHNIEVVISCDDDISLYTVRNDLMQVLLNLLKNAKDAYDERAVTPAFISIKAAQYDGWIKIVVQDNAGGISPAIIHDIFNPYFSTKDEKNGTGLGLYMSKMIIEDHLGGTIEVNSSDGTTEFTIRLPMGEEYGD